jgi:hypothetical protein
VRQLRVGEEVLDKDGGRLGLVERLVVDERAHAVTHLVVEGRLVGMARVRAVDGDRLAADIGRDELLRQPEDHADAVAAPPGHWVAPSGYTLDSFLRIVTALVGQGPYVPPIHADLDLTGIHEIMPGTAVWSGGRRVAEVTRVDTDDQSQIAALLLRLPGFAGHRVVMPAAHVVEVVGANVYVDLDREGIEALPRFDEPAG